MENTIAIGAIATPLGPVRAAMSAAGVCWLAFGASVDEALASWLRRHASGARVVADNARLGELAAELEAYFAGQLRAFSSPLDLRGTPFQLLVWRALIGVGYGETLAYSELAAAIGHPLAVRAVGAANGANPISVLVPCHRLIGKNGALVKYGGGLEVKRRLLELEGARVKTIV